MAAHFLGARVHVTQSVARTLRRVGISQWRYRKTTAVVAYLDVKLIVNDVQGDHRRRAAGMPCDVMDGFLEDELQVAALLRLQPDASQLGRGLKTPVDAFGFQNIDGKLPDARDQAVQIVLARIDRPHDVVDR